MAQKMLYFRGRCYEDSFRNRVVARFLTIIYKFSCFVKSLFMLTLLFVSLSSFIGCSPSAKIENSPLHNDSIRCDSFEFAGHSYIEFQQLSDYRFIVLHSPDCSCRYHRTFVVIKRNK